MAAGQFALRAAQGRVERNSPGELLPAAVIVAAFLLMIFVRVFRTDGRKGDEIQWEEVRQRELARRRQRTQDDPLPSGRDAN
jgi:hypothetical protein